VKALAVTLGYTRPRRVSTTSEYAWKDRDQKDQNVWLSLNSRPVIIESCVQIGQQMPEHSRIDNVRCKAV
jgi:hypothetical protein